MRINITDFIEVLDFRMSIIVVFLDDCLHLTQNQNRHTNVFLCIIITVITLHIATTYIHTKNH